MATILLVDDEQETVENLKFLFEMQENVTCWTASESDQALKLLTEHQPDFVLLDFRLPGSRLSGLGILKEAKEKVPSAKIFMVTGYNDDALRAQAEELGSDGFLEKPVAPEKLLELLKS